MIVSTPRGVSYPSKTFHVPDGIFFGFMLSGTSGIRNSSFVNVVTVPVVLTFCSR